MGHQEPPAWHQRSEQPQAKTAARGLSLNLPKNIWPSRVNISNTKISVSFFDFVDVFLGYHCHSGSSIADRFSILPRLLDESHLPRDSRGSTSAPADSPSNPGFFVQSPKWLKLCKHFQLGLWKQLYKI